MKKFLSMALAVIMACNFTLFSSGSIVSAEGWADYYDETWQFEGYDDEYVAFRIPQQSFKDLINSGNYTLVKYNGNDVIIKFHKEDVKEIIEEKPSKLKKFLKAVLWVAYTGIAAITSCGLYRIYNQHIDKMDKDKTTINENSTLFERIDANAANYTKMFNLYVDGTISPNLFGNASVFNKGINGTKSFFINNLNAMQTFLIKLWPFRKTNSSNTQQTTTETKINKENENQPESAPSPSPSSTPLPTQTPKPVETPQPSSSPKPEPTQTPNPLETSQLNIMDTQQPTSSSNKDQQPQSTPSPTPKPVETPQLSPSPISNLETETNGSTSIIPGGQQQVETNEQQGNNCGEGFIYKNGSCVPDNEQKNND